MTFKILISRTIKLHVICEASLFSSINFYNLFTITLSNILKYSVTNVRLSVLFIKLNNIYEYLYSYVMQLN